MNAKEKRETLITHAKNCANEAYDQCMAGEPGPTNEAVCRIADAIHKLAEAIRSLEGERR